MTSTPTTKWDGNLGTEGKDEVKFVGWKVMFCCCSWGSRACYIWLAFAGLMVSWSVAFLICQFAVEGPYWLDSMPRLVFDNLPMEDNYWEKATYFEAENEEG